MRWERGSIGALILILFAGCPVPIPPPTPYVDIDANCDHAMPLPPNLVITDSVDSDTGDYGDCKVIKH